MRFCQLLSAPFLVALETQIFVNNLRNWLSMDPPPHVKFLDCSVALRFVFLTQQQRLNCVDVFISMRTASAAARTPVDCSKLHQQPVDAVLRPAFVQKLCYKLPSVVTFTFIQTSTFCFLFWMESRLAHLLDTVSKLALFSVSGWKDKTFMKKPNLHEKWNVHTLFYSLLNISAKYHQNWSLKFCAISFQSLAIFWDRV